MAGPRVIYNVLVARDHEYPRHPERPDRVDRAEKALDTAGYFAHDRCEKVRFLGALVTKGYIGGNVSIPEGLPAQIEHLAGQLHPYLASLPRGAAVPAGGATVVEVGDEDGCTWVNPGSVDDALEAAVSAVAVTRAVLASAAARAAGGPAARGFSVARPPGHHATRATPIGFCLLNNVAIAARAALADGVARKILLVDFDVHHGNGTEAEFWGDERVLFVDVHEEGSTYPQTDPPFAPHDEATRDPAGTTINVPLPLGSGHAEVVAAFDRVVLPAAERFAPDLVLISAGYDAHARDPFKLLRYRTRTYRELVRRLAGVADRHARGALSVILEGGYSAEAVADSVLATWRELLGEDAVDTSEDDEGEGADGQAAPPSEAVEGLIRRLRELHGLA